MATNNYKVGDIVKLSSGGPDMTIQSLPTSLSPNYYHCQWFAGKKLEAGRFPGDSLEAVEVVGK